MVSHSHLRHLKLLTLLSRVALSSFALVASLLAPSVARADSHFWLGTDPGGPWWDAPGNWSPAAQPANGDSANILYSSAANGVVWYYNTLYPSAVLGELKIDGSGVGTIEMQINGYNYPLAATNEYIGYAGRGYFYQNTGTNTVNTLHLAYQTGSQGRYTLTDTGVLTTSATEVGYAGVGTFLQTGGTHTAVDTLRVAGELYGGAGTYLLSSGTLNDHQLWVGMFAGSVGNFVQSGGVHTATGDLVVGGNSGIGTYDLSGGTLNSIGYPSVWIGSSAGNGTFIQRGGTHHVAGADLGFIIGVNGNGTYLLSGGTLQVDSGVTRVGYGSTTNAYFGHSAGTHTTPSLVVGAATPGGIYSLSGSGVLNVTGDAYVADGNGGLGTFNQTGGSHWVGGSLVLANNFNDISFYSLGGGNLTVTSLGYIGNWGTATVSHGGGTHSVDQLCIGFGNTANGTYLLSGTGQLSSGSTFVGYEGHGTFIQTGGRHNATAINVAYNPNSVGYYRLDNGTISASVEMIGDDTGAAGTFVQNSGVNLPTNVTLAGYRSTAVGTFLMNGGTLSVSGDVTVGAVGSGTFTQTAGDVAVSGTLVISTAGVSGNVTKSGGKLTAARVVNNGIFTHSGGTLAVSNSFTNSGSATIGGIQQWSPGATFTNTGSALFTSDARDKTLSLNDAANRVVFQASQHLAGLQIGAGAITTLSSAPNRLINTNSLSIAGGTVPTGRLDLTIGKLIVDYTSSSPIGVMAAQIIGAYAGGAWTGLGITSNSADASVHGLGYGEAGVVLGPGGGVFGTDVVDGTAVLVKYTYYGDANLDGQVDISDLARLATNWQTSNIWTGGDFNYDRFVDISDLAKLATNWQAGVGAPLGMSFEQARASVGLGGVSVPEPVSGLVMGGFCLIRRRKRIA